MFDPRVHPAALTDQDLETLQRFGLRRVLLVCDGSVHPATPAAHFAHFEHLLGPQVLRFERAGLSPRVCLGVHPTALPRRGLSHILETLPGYLKGGKVAALGVLGLARGTEAEEEALLEQLALARRLGLSALVATPLRNREPMTRRLLTVLKASRLPRERILVDGAVGRTVRTILSLGFWTGLTVHPEHLTAERAVALVASLGPERLVLDTSVGDGGSDLLALPRVVHLLGRAGLTRSVVRRVSEGNATSWLRPGSPSRAHQLVGR
jgi:predicted metal-dependent TIM-barrel fold hydrolase